MAHLTSLLPRFRSVAQIALVLMACTAGAGAALRPYVSDSSTLHLWHMNEVSEPVLDSGSVSLSLNVLGGGATLGNTGYTGFGTALSTFDGGASASTGTATAIDAYLAPAAAVYGAGDNVTSTFVDSSTGAFTFEALVRIDFDPAATITRLAPMQILSGDQDGSGGGVRSFQFRLDPKGFNPGADGFTSALTAPALEFISIRNGSGVENKILALPTTGAEAIAQGSWYHVAVTYSGSAGTTNSLLFYWTKLDASRSQATLLGSKTLTNDLSTGDIDFQIGNTGRASGSGVTPNNNFVGLIDEVRISNIARGATGFVFYADTDSDGLDDAWESTYFGSLAQGAADDFDGDGATNFEEYNAGSNPASSASTPTDIDGNGLTDSWERQYFGSIGNNANADPDGDTFSNAAEQAAGTNPTVAASRPDNLDGDSLPDPWEVQFFGSTSAQGDSGDPDSDGYTNLQEFQGGSLPTNANSAPAPALTKYTPISDGNSATSEWGYGGDSNINATAFICSALQTVGNYQFLAYYGRHETNSSYSFNNTIWIARRTVGAATWQVFRTNFTANAITDGHDVISFGIDGEGVMHMSWGMHNDTYHYAKTTTPVTGGQTIVFGSDLGTMTGNESVVTYPQFLTLPNGDLLYFYRHGDPATGGSGSGNEVLNRYSLATHTWTNVQGSGETPFIKGIWTNAYNAYLNMPCVDDDGNLLITWTWRYTTNWQTNEHLAFARSTDAGLTWKRSTGSAYSLPISENAESGVENTRAEQIYTIPQQSSLINQAGMCVDDQGNPVIATWWAPETSSGNYRRQYMAVFPGTMGTTPWIARQVSNRTMDATTFKDTSASDVRDLARPVPVCTKDGRIVILYRDNQDTNGLTIVYSLPRAQDPQRTIWKKLDLSTANLGNYEPVIDLARWKRDNVLQAIYQPSTGNGFTANSNTASEIGVVEFNAATYFNPNPQLYTAFVNNGSDVALSFASQSGWNYEVQTSTDLTNWTTLTTVAGTGSNVTYTHTGGGGGAKRFWRLKVTETTQSSL